MNNRVYLDNASTTQLDPQCLDLIIELERNIYANPSSLHEFGQRSKNLIREARSQIAESLDLDHDEIVFTSGATESNNSVVWGFKPDLILTTTIEHPSLLEPVKQSNKEIIWLECTEEGYLSLEQIQRVLRLNTNKKILLSVMHANNEIGTIQDLYSIGQLKAKYPNVIFHSDCSQSFAKYKIKPREWNLDAISASAHKIHATKGLGLLYLKKELQNDFQPFVRGGAQEFDLRSGTENTSAIMAFAKAVEIASRYNSQIQELQTYLYEALKSIPGLVLNGPPLEERLIGNLNFSFTALKFNSEDLVLQLSLRGICVSSGSACSNNKSQITGSYVLRACRLPSNVIDKAIRISISRFNTREDIDCCIATLKSLHNLK